MDGQLTDIYEDIFEASSTPTMVHDADSGAVQRANPAACQLLGLDREELLGTPVGEFSPGEYTTAEAESMLQRAVAEDGTTVEWVVEGPDGQHRSVDVELQPLDADEGRRVVAFVRTETYRELDNRERTRAEQLRTLVENLPVVVFTLDPDGVFTYSAGKALAKLGLEQGELEGVSVFDAYADYPDIVEAARTAVAGEEVRVTQEIDDLVFETWYRPVTDDSGSLAQVVGVARDITDHVRREERVERLSDATHELLYSRTEAEVADTVTGIARQIIDRPIAAMWSYDEDTDTLYPVGSTTEAAAFADVDIAANLPPMEPGTDEKEIFDAGEPVLIEDYQELSNPSAPGVPLRTLLCLPLEEYGLLCVGSPRVEQFGETERLLLDILASTAAAALERVEHEAKMRDQRQELERSNRALQEFAYIASHDLQEPLRMVASYVDLLDREYGDELDDEASEYMDFAVDGAHRMQDMIDALLQYSRVETQGNEFERVDPETVLETTLSALQLRIDETDATVTVGSLPAVEADPDQLGQLFQNLLENAITYAAEDGVAPAVEIEGTRTDDTVTVTVSDNGPGIPEGMADDVFEIFNRGGVHDTDGTGIGLAVCRRIVQRHDGEIWVEDGAEGGATFGFTLPVPTEARADD